MSDSSAAASSKLGKGSKASGRLVGSGSVELLGELTGEVDWTGLVVIGPDARLVADARVESLDLSGVLEGRVVASVEVFVRRGSRWIGGCVAPVMSTEAGAWVEGEFRVRPLSSP
jgi:cytoskeletal protein CcmA (bactofilin family)